MTISIADTMLTMNRMFSSFVQLISDKGNCHNFIFWSYYTKPMKYFWWRFLDYAVGVFVGGLMVFLADRFLCHDCIGHWTPLLMLAIWISLMLFCNFLFQVFRPKQVTRDK